MTNDTSTTISLPSMLSFERKLETSDGLMFSGSWEDRQNHDSWSNIQISTRQNRSTQSAYGIDDIKKTAPNPVSSDSDDANLPMNHDTLKLSFSLRIVGELGKPFACNNPRFAERIESEVNKFKQSEGMDELASRYAYNIANGRFLWRNRVGADEIQINVYVNNDESALEFNAYDFSLKGFDDNRDNESLKQLAGAIKEGLANDDEDAFTFLKVEAFVKLGNGQHVFPSQEMNMGEKKKRLFQLNGCAAMHNVKIGNAIRTIDTWYGDKMLIKTKNDKGKDTTKVVDVDVRIPIAIEPYGSVTQHGRAYRSSAQGAPKNDLYTLMLNWVNEKGVEPDQQKFVVGNLIRGGVFGGDGEG